MVADVATLGPKDPCMSHMSQNVHVARGWGQSLLASHLRALRIAPKYTPPLPFGEWRY